MARIKPLSPSAVPELKAVFEAGEKIMGFVPNDGLTMAYKPAILKAFLGLVQSIYAPGKVDGGLKRLIGLITSNAAGCQYCQAHAANAANEQSIAKEKINAIWEFESSNLFSAAEKAALTLALKAGMAPNEVTDQDFSELKLHFDDEAIIEIVSVISMYGFLNRWNATLQTELEDKPKTFFQGLSK